jgi:hypothetical protein
VSTKPEVTEAAVIAFRDAAELRLGLTRMSTCRSTCPPATQPVVAGQRGQVTGLLRHPLPRRVRRGAKDVHTAGGDLHDEQDIDTFEPDRVHVKESRRPGWPWPDRRGTWVQFGPLRRGAGVDTGGMEDLKYGAGRDPIAQPDQLTPSCRTPGAVRGG